MGVAVQLRGTAFKKKKKHIALSLYQARRERGWGKAQLHGIVACWRLVLQILLCSDGGSRLWRKSKLRGRHRLFLGRVNNNNNTNTPTVGTPLSSIFLLDDQKKKYNTHTHTQNK